MRVLLDHTATYLKAGHPPREASRQLELNHGLSHSTANRYVAAVLRQWQADAALEPAESKRSRLVESLHGNIVKALTRVKTYTNKDGEAREYDEPDFRAANQAIELIAKLEGLTGSGS